MFRCIHHSHTTLCQVHLKCMSCTRWHQGWEISENTLLSGLVSATLCAVAAHLGGATAAWLNYEAPLQLSWLWVPHHHLPWPRQFPPSACPAFPTPLSHSHASCCPPQDPATPTPSKIKPGSPSQDPPLWHSAQHPWIYFSPSTGGGLCSTIMGQQDDLKLVNFASSSSVGKGRSAVFTEGFKKQDIYLTVLPWHVFPAYEKSKL